jgi:hypothetical protein
MPICTFDDSGKCLRHERVHYGHTKQQALDPSEQGERIRETWDKAMKKSKPIPFLTGGCTWGTVAPPAMMNIALTVNAAGFTVPLSFQIPRLSMGLVKLWAGYGQRAIVGKSEACGAFPAEWTSPHEWYANLMATTHDGPLEAFKLTLEHFSETGRFQIVASKLNLLSCTPFLAIGAGIFACSDIAASNTPCANIYGSTWSATVTEC